MNIPSPTKNISPKSAPLATTGKQSSSNQPATTLGANGSPDKSSECKGLSWGQVKSKSVTSNYAGDPSNQLCYVSEADGKITSFGEGNPGNEVAPGWVAPASTPSTSTYARGLNRKGKNLTGNTSKGT